MGFYEDGYRARFPGEPWPTEVPPNVANVVEAARTRLPRHEAWLASEHGDNALLGKSGS